jgi:hypothetical protein
MAMVPMTDLQVHFIKASIWHGSLERSQALLAAHPELASSDIHIAAILGEDAAVREFLSRDPGSVTAKSEPHGAEPLVYLCLSKYLRLDPARSDAFIRAATALLDAGPIPTADSGPPARIPSSRRRCTAPPASPSTRG